MQNRWLCAVVCAAAVAAVGQAFTNTAGPMTTVRTDAAAVRLQDGTVLVLGGYVLDSAGQQHALDSAEIFDPATSTFHPTGSMTTARSAPLAALLPDGNVLVVGGEADMQSVQPTAIYDAAHGTFSSGPALPQALDDVAGLTLSDGRVWITGFDHACDLTGAFLCMGRVDIYDPAKGAFLSAPPLNTGRRDPSLALLKGGRVLVTGGWGDNPGTGPLGTAELYDPVKLTDTLSAGSGPFASLIATRTLPDGRVLLAGGNTHFGPTTETYLYDPAKDAFTRTAHDMAQERQRAQAFLLPDGTVLVAGGDTPDDAEIYTPALDAFSPAGKFNTDRPGFAAAQLTDGGVLFAGGGTASAEMFTPAATVSPDFSLTTDATQVVVTTGSTATFKITAQGANQFASSIDLTCAGNDSIQCAFAPGSIQPASSSTLTVSGIDLTGPPMVRFNVVGTSGSRTHTLGLQLDVEPPTAFLTPTSLSFGDQAVGSTSATQTVTLGDRGATDLSIAAITVEGDFTESTHCPSTISHIGGQTCTITLAFAPTAAGARGGRLLISDNAPFSPQTVTLTGTGTAAPAPVVQLAPASLAFPATVVGSTSAAQTVTLTNTGTAVLTGVGIAASGDFSQTNNCGTSVDAGQNCAIQVTFAPSATGTRSGQIAVSDNAPGNPQTANLGGSGTDASAGNNSVGFTTPPGGSTSATVQPGQSAIYNLSLAAAGSFSGQVTLTCTGAPSGATCAPSPATVTVGGTPTAVSVNVTTGANPAAIWLWLEFGLIGFAPVAFAPRRGRKARCRRVLVVAAAGLLLAACGGAPGATPPPRPVNGSTPAGTYTLTVTASSAGTTVGTEPLTLTVE